MDPQTITAPIVASFAGHEYVRSRFRSKVKRLAEAKRSESAYAPYSGPFGAFSVKRLAAMGMVKELGDMRGVSRAVVSGDRMEQQSRSFP
jgi:thiamine thiazole synthase